jgi:membrane-bound lytic murein transglycosylase D
VFNHVPFLKVSYVSLKQKTLRQFHTFSLLCVLFVLIGYTTYSKLSEKPEITFEPTIRYQEIYPVEMPEMLTLAGEVVPLDNRDVMERFDREINLNTYWHANTMLMLKRANRWFPQIEPILKQHGLHPDLKYIVVVESMFENVVSPRGATGFWQLMEGTALELGLEVNDEVDERYHPLKSTHAACKYLKRAYKSYGNYANTMASYNMGIGGFSKAVKNQQQDSYYDLLLNGETSRYVFRILAVKELLESPDKYGFKVPKKNLYKREKMRKVKVTESIPDLTAWALQQNISYKVLKQYNPWLRANTLTIKEGKTYTIDIPVNPPIDEEEAAERPDSMRLDTMGRGQQPVGKSLLNNRIALANSADISIQIEIAEEKTGKALMQEATLNKPATERLLAEKEKAEKPKSKTQVSTARKQVKHVAKRKEKVSDIATAYNISEDEILEWNQLDSPRIKRGQELVLYVESAEVI